MSKNTHVAAFIAVEMQITHLHDSNVATTSSDECSFCLRQDYCASKFAAVGFHESMAHELLAEEVDGVKTTLVCPYIVDTGMFEGCKIRYVSRTASLTPPSCLQTGFRIHISNQGRLHSQVHNKNVIL